MKNFRKKISRRRFLGGVSFAGLGTLGYARFIEAHSLETCRVTVPLAAGAREPLKVLHLSDLHASSVVSLEYIAEAVELGLRGKPDLICVTGDFITSRYDRLAEYSKILRRLSDAAPAFASLGNHDGGSWASDHGGFTDIVWVSELLSAGRIELLHNSSKQLQLGDWKLNLVGLGDLWGAGFDPGAAFHGITKSNEQPTILLSHNPDTKEFLGADPWHLMLCGHTHGGQLSLPLIGTPFAPVRDQRFVAGLHRWSERWIHITKGVGSIYGVRINCPPEVSLLTLT